MKRIIPLIGLTLITFNSCSSDSDISLPDEPAKVPVIGVYTKENQWIYEQMNHYYLWREDLQDSLSCDYTTDPVTFYKALLSPKDRFPIVLVIQIIQDQLRVPHTALLIKNIKVQQTETYCKCYM